MKINYNSISEAITLLRYQDPERFQEILVLIIDELTSEICELIDE